MAHASEGAAPGESLPDPENLPVGRSLSDFGKLSKAESALLEACRRGKATRLSANVPKKALQATRVRAAFLRFLLLGGGPGASVHESGISLVGAFVTGELNLSGATCCRSLKARNCNFDSDLVLRDARAPTLSLQGCHIPRLIGDRFHCDGSLFLRTDFHADEVKLGGAYIGGDLDCSGSTFGIETSGNPGPDDDLIDTEVAADALMADGIKIAGDLFLRSGFQAWGTVRFVGAEVAGDISCSGGSFDNPNGIALILDRADSRGTVFFSDGCKVRGEVRLMGLQVQAGVDFTDALLQNPGGSAVTAERAVLNGGVMLGANLVSEGSWNLIGAVIKGNLLLVGCNLSSDGATLDLSGAEVTGTFILLMATIKGSLDLSRARVDSLSDSWESYEAIDRLKIDGLCYNRISSAPVDAETRLKWLRLQKSTDGFFPQPWEQLAKILREMGHTEDAKVIAIQKQKEMRNNGVIGTRSPRADLQGLRRRIDEIWTPISNWLERRLHAIYGGLAGYGHRPLRTVAWMVGCWLAATAIYWAAANDGMIGPTNIRLYTDDRFVACGDGGMPGKQPWTRCGDLPAEYTAFNPAVYSLDLILPVVDVRQEQDWAPMLLSADGQPLRLGWLLRLFVWFEVLFGWLTSLLLVSALGRLIPKD